MPPHPCNSAIALPTLYTGCFVSSGGSVSRKSLSSGHCTYHDSVMTQWNFACNMHAGSAWLHLLVAKLCRNSFKGYIRFPAPKATPAAYGLIWPVHWSWLILTSALRRPICMHACREAACKSSHFLDWSSRSWCSCSCGCTACNATLGLPSLGGNCDSMAPVYPTLLIFPLRVWYAGNAPPIAVAASL